MPELIGKRKEMPLVAARKDAIVIVDVCKIDQARRPEPLTARARGPLDRAEAFGERELLRIVEELVTEHDDGVAIECGVNLGDIVVRQSLAHVDIANDRDKLRLPHVDDHGMRRTRMILIGSVSIWPGAGRRAIRRTSSMFFVT